MPANPFPYIFHFVSLSSKCNETRMEKTKWSENVILIDCDYADEVTRNLKVNYSRMLNRSLFACHLTEGLPRVPTAYRSYWFTARTKED